MCSPFDAGSDKAATEIAASVTVGLAQFALSSAGSNEWRAETEVVLFPDGVIDAVTNIALVDRSFSGRS